MTFRPASLFVTPAKEPVKESKVPFLCSLVPKIQGSNERPNHPRPMIPGNLAVQINHIPAKL